jgi:hypothetical protein
MSAPPQAQGSPTPLAWRFLLVTSGFFVVFGIATAWLGSLPPASLWGGWIAEALLARPFGADEARIYDFMRGPLGGTMAGYYVLQTAIVAGPLRRRERWAWSAVLAGVCVWFVVDSAASLAHGALFNVVRVNLLALVITVVPLLLLGRPAVKK